MNSRDILFKELKNYSTSDISKELHFADEIAKLLYALTDESDVSLIVDKVEKPKVKSKIKDSLLIFGEITDSTIADTRKEIEFILVYNEERFLILFKLISI